MLCLLTFNSSYLNAVDGGGGRATKLAQLEQATQKFMTSLKGYRDCTTKGTCTESQKRNLKKMGVTIAALTVATVVAGFLGKSHQKKQQEMHRKPSGAEIETRKFVQFNPDDQFAMAVLMRNQALAGDLLEQGASVDARWNDMSILENVVKTEDKDMVKWLLDQGALPSVNQDILKNTSPEIRNMITDASFKFRR